MGLLVIKMVYIHVCLSLVLCISQLVSGSDILLCQSKDTILDVSCPDDKVLVFEWAEYGRQDTLTCSSGGGYVAKTDCKLPSTLALLQEQCFKKHSCTLSLKKMLVPDPCPRTAKYLKARYSCVLESDIIPLCSSYYIKEKKSGYLISPNYPNTYNANQRCTSEIIPSGNDNTRLELLDIEVEARTSKGCYDWLKMEEKEDPAQHYSYCGTMESVTDPKIMSFKSPVIKFLPDQMNEYRGFLIKFEAVAGKMKETGAVANGDKSTENKIQQLEDDILRLKTLRNQRKERLRRQKQEELERQQKLAKERQQQEAEFEAQQREKLQVQVAEAAQANQLQQVAHQEQEQFGDGCVKESIHLPPNSYILSYKEGRKVHISCSEGYDMEDEDDGLLLCHNDQWVGIAGKCISRACEVPETPDHGEVIYRKISIGSDVEFICHKGYVLYGERSLTCRPDGQWSGHMPFCEKGGVKSLSLFGEFLLACIVAALFLYFKKRVPRLLNGISAVIWRSRKLSTT